MAEENYVTINRSLLPSRLWLEDKPFTRGQAWVDMIMLANWKRDFIWKRGVKVVIERGYIGRSQTTLAERWGWSRGKVRRFFHDLEEEQQIEQQKNNVTTLIKLVNYDKYQLKRTANDTADEPQTVQQTDRRRYSNKKGNKDKKGNNVIKGLSVDSLPEQISHECAGHYIDHRKAIKKPLSQKAFDMAMKKVVKISEALKITPDRVVDTAIESGWQGIEVDWVSRKLGIPIKNGKDFSEGADNGNRF